MPPESSEIPHDAQVTNNQIYALLVETRGIVDTHSRILEDLDLNGLGKYVKPFFEQYAATYQSRQAWQTVRADILLRLRFLAPGKHWLGILLAGALGAIGWQLGGETLLRLVTGK